MFVRSATKGLHVMQLSGIIDGYTLGEFVDDFPSTTA